MIKKLRKKFIFINMALVTLVLLIVFSTLCFTSYHSMRRQSFDFMRRIINLNLDKPWPKFEIGERKPREHTPFVPVFCVQLNNHGELAAIILRENIEVSDETVAQAIEEVKTNERDFGTLSAFGLRYLKMQTPNGLKIAFADMCNERSTMANLLLTSFLVGIGGLTAFFLISLFLSGWALRPVERAWMQQRQFVADASHELKTPLTVILANAEILCFHRADTIDHQIKWVEYIRAEADRMKKLVEDMLFLAKSDAARVPIQRELVNFSDIVWNSLLPFESVAFEQGVELSNEIQSDIMLFGNEGQLKQLVVILLDNACKYTGENGLVQITLEQFAARVKLVVKNTGSSEISQEDLEHLFERFYRVDKARDRNQGGSGLGLAIAKSIVEGHKGKLTVESGEDLVTTFSVVLPIK